MVFDIHIESKYDADLIKYFVSKTWWDGVKTDMKSLVMSQDDTQIS